MWKRSCAVGAVALAAAVTTPAFGAVWLSKITAHEIAVKATSETCRSVDWCVRSEVTPVKSCRRVRAHTVYCPIRFVTADGRHCTGLVTVKKTRTGRIDRGMAVPMNCGAGASAAATAVPV
jgi:hypothetical protein